MAYAASKVPIAGYHCMMLNQSPDQMRDPNSVVYYRTKPEPNAPTKGIVETVVAVQDGTSPTNGFVPALTFNRAEAWAPVQSLAPYRSASASNTTCEPAIRADGKLDFIFKH
ncbi:hypothetical protein AA0488_2943 [Kozakia baliensis NRIC 0488]|nr:hypothetical protein AA0488_2943 [Kozakia baliensis NRIC 0488]